MSDPVIPPRRGVLARLEQFVHIAMCVTAGALVAGLAIIMVLQVVRRYFFDQSLDWPDEMAAILLAWITFVGAALAARDNEHIGLPLLQDSLPEPWKSAVIALIDVFVIIVLAVLTWYSIPLVLRTWDQSPVTFEISRGLLYVVMPVCCLIMLGYLLAASPLTRWLRRR